MKLFWMFAQGVRRRALLAILLAIVAPSVPFESVNAADNEVSELLEEADTAYQQGHLRIATTRLQQAMNLLRDLEYTRSKALFPEPLKGWVKDNDSKALEDMRALGMGSLFVTAQAYRRGDENLRIMLLQKPSLANPVFGLLLAGLEGTVAGGEKVSVGPYKGKLSCPEVTPPQCHLLVDINHDYVVYAEGKLMKKDDVLAYARAMPLEKIENFR